MAAAQALVASRRDAGIAPNCSPVCRKGLRQVDFGAAYGVSQTTISQAITVIRVAPELVPLVVNGTELLADAWREARRRQRSDVQKKT